MTECVRSQFIPPGGGAYKTQTNPCSLSPIYIPPTRPLGIIHRHFRLPVIFLSRFPFSFIIKHTFSVVIISPPTSSISQTIYHMYVYIPGCAHTSVLAKDVMRWPRDSCLKTPYVLSEWEVLSGTPVWTDNHIASPSIWYSHEQTVHSPHNLFSHPGMNFHHVLPNWTL